MQETNEQLIREIPRYLKDKHLRITIDVLAMMRRFFVQHMREHGIEPNEFIKSGDFINYYTHEWNMRN